MRTQLDEFYNIAINLRDCAQASNHIGNPFTKEGVSSYTQYIDLTDDLYKCYNSLANYFSMLGAHMHDQVF